MYHGFSLNAYTRVWLGIFSPPVQQQMLVIFFAELFMQNPVKSYCPKKPLQTFSLKKIATLAFPEDFSQVTATEDARHNV